MGNTYQVSNINKVGYNNANTTISHNRNHQSFQQVFKDIVSKNSDVKFSKHATQRLEDRNINLSRDEIVKINKAIDLADSKGIKDTLIIIKDIALIANVKNKTIITAATEEGLKENVFTNIDGAVIL